MLAEAGYTDVTVVDPANGLPTLEYLQNNGYNTLIFNRAVWSTDQPLMNQVFAAGINLFTSGDDSNSGLDIIQDSTTISQIDSLGDIEGNDTLFTNRVGQINGHADVGTYIHFISGAETFYTRVVNGTTYGVGGCYTNNGTRWFHFQEAIGLYNNSDSKIIKEAVDYMANKGLVYFKIPSDNTYTFDITDNAGNVLQITHAIQGYTVEYYQGNNTSSESASMLPYTSQFDNDVEYNLLTYSALGGVAPSGWTFAGWTTEKNSTNIVYQDGQSVTNLASGGNTVKLYAVFMRTVTIYSGYNKATSSTAIQYYNPCKNTYYTKINVPAPSTTGLSGWSARGYRSDTTAADKTYTVTTSAANIGLDPSVGNTIYAVYSRTITMYHGKNKATTSTATQYYNTNNSVSSISAPAPSTTNLSGWNARGYREDTSTSDRTYAVTTSAANIKPAYNSSKTLYAVYSRTVTFAYNGNGSTSGSTASQTGTQYYNTNNAVSTVTVKSQSNGFTRTGYIFNKWAYDSASGTQVAAGSNISFAPTVDKTGNNLTRTMFATWTAKTVTVKYYRNSSSSDTSTASQTFTYDVANQKFGYENGSPKWGTSGQFGSWDRTGYKLLGWSTNRSATSATYSPYNGVSNSWINSSYDNNSNHTVTLYGIWQSVAITVIQDGVLKQSGVIVISSSSARRQEQNATCSTTSITAFESIRPSEQGYAYGTKRFYGTMAVGHHANGWESDCYPYYDITITFNSAYNGRTATFELYAMHTARFFRGNAQFYVNGTLKKETGENGWDTYFSGYNAAMEASYSSTVTINSNASLRLRVAAKTGSNDQWAPIVWGGIRNLTISA